MGEEVIAKSVGRLELPVGQKTVDDFVRLAGGGAQDVGQGRDGA